MIVSIMLIVVGFSCYYLVPYALFKQYYTLMFMLLNMVLILVIIGMTFICVLIFEYLEQLMLWISINTCCRRDKRLKYVIEKNMEAHRPRNSKTSLMFTLAISFLIYSASSFALISSLVVKTSEQIIGSDLLASAQHWLNEIPIAEFLDTQMTGDDPAIVDYAFTTIKSAKFSKLMQNSTDDAD